MRRRWITGDALTTLLALRGLQPGDEVKIRACDSYCYDLPNKCTRVQHFGDHTHIFFAEETVLTVEEVGGKYWQYGRGEFLARNLKTLMGTYVARHNIKAWRPAKEKKHG